LRHTVRGDQTVVSLQDQDTVSNSKKHQKYYFHFPTNNSNTIQVQ